ncbi:MAG: acetolactate synthase small subunit [Cyclobacteriaceae bacterium]|nr:acetolactate synthase small subunit [Cyclobacteriaceae bacterium]
MNVTKKEFTISVFSENHVGVLHRITTIFTRRGINIESITVSESEIHGVHRFNIVVTETEDHIKKVVKQIEKQIEVLRSFYYPLSKIIYQEIALYKLPIKAVQNGAGIEQIIRDNHARILTVEKDFLVIEKTGHKGETQALFEQLEPFGLLEFVRSGRVALAKSAKSFKDYLKVPELGKRITEQEVREMAEKID